MSFNANAPCLGCKDRTQTCHGPQCKKYQEFRKKRKELAEKEKRSKIR